MKKISIYLLLMAFFAPLAMMGQESLNEKNISHDNTPTLSRGGTITVYKRVTSPTSGRNYLIVSSQTANSDAYALSQNSSTASSITSSSVHINPGINATGNTVYINSDGLEPTAVWKAASGWTFSHQKSDNKTYYLYCNRTTSWGSTTVNLQANTSSQNWNYSNNTLYWHYSGVLGIGAADYYIKYNNGFTVGTGSANVYLFEETNVDIYTVNASVSPSGVGRVTGDGVYIKGLTCTLTATAINSDYDFVNWTEDGVVVSTDSIYSITNVSTDHNLVANFESNVTCPKPIHLTAGTPTGHSVPLSWTSEAENFNVRYRTLGEETTLFFEGFENGLGNWTTIRNGGGNANTDWQTSNTAYQGSKSAISRSYYESTNYNVDNWLITPRVTLDGILKFWVRDNGSYHDHYDVYVSTTGNNIENFSLLYEPGDASGTWTEVTVDLTVYNGAQGYIALRHTDHGNRFLYIDNFGIYNYRFGDWCRPFPTTSNSYTLTGLSSQTAYQAEVQTNCGGGALSEWSNRVNFITTAPSTAAPTNLTVSDITINSATASWQGVAANEYHQSYDLYYATSDVTSVPDSPAGPNYVSGLTATSYDITGLRPETEYHVWVRDYCGTDGKSAWTAFTPFTTAIACFAPTNVTASNVTNNSVIINWTGSEAESYNLRYGTIEGFRYGFEDAEPWNYTNFSPCSVYDGDGYGTGAIQDVTFENQHYTGAFIAFQNVLEGAYAHSGNAFGACFYATTAPNNDYFILPAITIESGYVFKFWAKSYSSNYLESFRAGVYNGNGNLTTVLGSITSVPTDWTEYTYNLSSYVGQTIQLAINCNSNDKFAFFIDDIFVGNPNSAWSEPIAGVTSPYTLTGLADFTDYEVQVQANCGSTDGLSQWSASATFQTFDDCVIPFSQSTTDITPSAATLNWDGMQSSYNVRYRLTYSGQEQTIENFSGYNAADYDATGTLPTGWKGYSSGDDKPHIANNSVLASTSLFDTSHEITGMGGSGSTDNFLLMISNRSNPYTSYTILPHISHIVSVSFNYAFEDASNGTLSVGYCMENTSGSSFVAFNDVTLTGTATNTRITLTANDIATINQGNRYLAFRWECQSTSVLSSGVHCVGIDNVTIDYVPYVDGGWTTEANVNSPLTINSLSYNTEYEWQAQGVDCDGNGSTTNRSASTIFTTLPAQEFTKTIDPYEGDGGYYLIASPIEETTTPSADNGFITTGDYDFYYFDQSDPESKEWVNYDTNPFNVVNGKGYLYASANGTTLSFVGTPYRGNGQVTLSKDDDAEFIGWNLVGNPFPEAASLNKAFYTMNPAGDEVIAAQTNSVAPMEGVFVIADSDNETLTFTMTNSKNSMVALNLSNGNNLIDRAVVNFGEARTLPKFQLNPNHTKVYIPQDGMNYAVVSSEEQGEMPVSFKAENNGNYSISFATEEVNFAYLHLIDNMTGIDVDLLETPSYSFEAKSTDYESRFKLVFVCGDTSDDTFAFYNNGSWVINNEGEATLQVIDVNGRILKSESINGNTNIDMNAAAGVYMLRLVNGENVKVQKVVVR